MNTQLTVQTFFTPIDADALEPLLKFREEALHRINLLLGVMTDPDMRYALDCFHRTTDNSYQRFHVSVAFDVTRATAALDADTWQRAINLTDVYNYMPAKRQEEWDESIRSMTTPEFTAENLYPTIRGLLQDRMKFFAERVEGIFKGLSHTHVTNSPKGFNQRFILNYMRDSLGFTNYDKLRVLNDLRYVIARFMGRDTPDHNASNGLMDSMLRDRGEWLTLDGGALRVRGYLKGTVHCEVHESIAWQLNDVLATLYPAAIPSSERTAPKKVISRKLFNRPLPFAVIKWLNSFNKQRGHEHWSFHTYDWHKEDKFVKQEVIATLVQLGGACDGDKWYFGYDPADVLREVVLSGVIPDKRSYQFYPTPDTLAQRAVEWSGAAGRCLEPSAGLGAIARLLPSPVCVELSSVHATALRSQGFDVREADFLKWRDGEFDTIVMNPPYAGGQAEAHVKHAYSMLADNGTLVAVLPASFAGKRVLPGCEYSEVFENLFKGASVSVVLMRAVKL